MAIPITPCGTIEPDRTRPPARAAGEVELDRASPRRLAVLIADDDIVTASFFAAVIGQLGHEVHNADHGEQALAMLRERAYDVLISDWVMPRMSGAELIRQARRLRDDYLHIILMTSPDEERSIRDAMAAGADDFLHKPVTPLRIELSLGAAMRVVDLQRTVQRRFDALERAHDRIETAYRALRDDVEAASALQRQLLPADRLDGPIRFASRFTPCADIGGDNLGLVDCRDGRTGFFNIDVSGHGVPAALHSFSLHRRVGEMLADPAIALETVCATLNAILIADGTGQYCTGVFGRVAADGAVELVRAGHPFPLLARAGAGRRIEQGGYPLGLVDDYRCTVDRLALDPGERMLVHSDGVTDGGLAEAQLAELWHGAGEIDLATAIDMIEWRLLNARSGGAPADDISMMAIERAA